MFPSHDRIRRLKEVHLLLVDKEGYNFEKNEIEDIIDEIEMQLPECEDDCRSSQ